MPVEVAGEVVDELIEGSVDGVDEIVGVVGVLSVLVDGTTLRFDVDDGLLVDDSVGAGVGVSEGWGLVDEQPAASSAASTAMPAYRNESSFTL